MSGAALWDDVTVAIQRERDGDGFVIVGLSPDGEVILEQRVSREAGRFIWASLVTIAKQAAQ